jgi:hypothetical protein
MQRRQFSPAALASTEEREEAKAAALQSRRESYIAMSNE